MAGRAFGMTGAAGWPVLAGLLLLVVAPIGALIWVAGGAGALSPADLGAIRFTVMQALLSAALSVGLAVPFARALMRRRFWGRAAIISLLGAPFLLPVIVAILGLLAVWGRGGVISDIAAHAGLGRISIYGLAGILLAHVFFNLPLVTRLLIQGWQRVPADHFRLAGQLGMSQSDVHRVIERPILASVLPGAFLLVFLLCMTSFAVALALGGGPRATTIELAIYQALRFDFELGRAAALALVQFGLCAGVALLVLAVGRPAPDARGLGRTPARWDVDRRGLWADGLVIGITVAFLGLPLLAVLARGIPALLSGLPSGLGAALTTSLVLALSVATVTMIASVALAALIASLGRRGGTAAEGAGLMIMATSPFVIGTGLFVLMRGVVDPFAWALPVTGLINAAMALPFAVRALVPAFEAAHRDYGRLAANLGIGGLSYIRVVLLPLIRAPLGFAAGLSAALSFGDLGVITLFAPPGVETLPLYMYRLMGAYRMADAAGAALVLLATSLALFWIFDRGGRLGHSSR